MHLTVVQKVENIYHHPLRQETPKTYINQGQIWECVCDCGKHVLISEFNLARGRNKSCGCMRYKNLRPSTNEAQDLKLARLKNKHEIQELQFEQKYLTQAMRERNDPKDILRYREVGELLRAAFAKKANIASQYHRRKVDEPKQED
jgi:hypothetical protein